MAEFWQNKRVFVPGGAGFIGSYLCERLASLGAVVIVPKRPGANAINLAQASQAIAQKEINLEDEKTLAENLAGVDVVFYLATHTGGVLYSSKRHAEMFYNNLRPFLSTLEAARLAGVKKFLLTSSACVYPDDAPSPVNESYGFVGMPQQSNEGYGMAKRSQEYGCDIYSKEYGLPTVVVRLFNTYGPRGHFNPTDALVIPSLLRKILSAKDTLEVWGSGRAVRPFLFVDDCVDGLLLAAERGEAQTPINISSESGTSIGDLARILVRLCGREDLEIKFDASKPEGQLVRLADVTRAKQLLGFKPRTTLEQGLEKTIAWFKSELASGRQTL